MPQKKAYSVTPKISLPTHASITPLFKGREKTKDKYNGRMGTEGAGEGQSGSFRWEKFPDMASSSCGPREYIAGRCLLPEGELCFFSKTCL